MDDQEVVTIPSLRAWHKRMFATLERRFDVHVARKRDVYTITGPDAKEFKSEMLRYKEGANFLAQDAVHKKWPNGNAPDIDRQHFCHNPVNGVYKQMNDAFEGGDDVIHKWIPRSPKT